ncbi:MAG TPA: uracil-DNA glycosylase, partial [Candidatus Lokiarchaeia archaeon]
MNKGFFFEDKIEKVKKIKSENNSKIKREIDLCEKCGLYKNCNSPKMQYTGKGKKEILIIGESPGKTENIKGIQFIGESGQLLRKYFKELNINFEEDCWKTNSVICYQENKTPTIAQVNYCRRNLKEAIEKLKPKKILTFGKVALQGLVGDKVSVTGINEWVGWQIPDQDYQCYIYPNYHPAYLLRNKDDIILNKKFKEYLSNA